MSKFNASLIPQGDPQPIDTTVEIDGTVLELRIGSESLGSWQIEELQMERILGGVSMNVDGEKAVLRLDDPDPFIEAVGLGEPSSKKKEKKPRRRRSKPDPVTEVSEPVVAEPPRPSPPPEPKAPQKHRKDKKDRKAKKANKHESKKEKPEVGWLDQTLEGMSARWGDYLPDWLFTKGGLLIIFGVLLALIAKPQWFSIGLLVLAAIGLGTSAVAMVDQVVATRLFKGAYTPAKVLVGSLVVGIIGILLGGFF